MSGDGATGHLGGSVGDAGRCWIRAVTSHEVPITADFGGVDREAPRVKGGDEEETKDEVRQAGS